MGLAMRFAVLSFFSAVRAESVVVGLTKMALSQDPTSEQYTAWELIKIGVAEKLFTMDAAGDVVPQLAEKIEGDDKSWVVTLKSGVKFSDGSALTAADVKTCLDLMMAGPGKSTSVSAITFTADGDTKLKVEPTDSTHIMGTILAEWSFPIYKKSGDKFLFTGPYTVSHMHTTAGEEHIDLKPNANYHGEAGADQRPDIEVKKYADGAALLAAAVAKEVDLAFTLSVDDLDKVNAVDGMSTISYEAEYQYMLIHNMNSTLGRAPTDLKVRQAIDHALDRTALSQVLRSSSGTRSYFPKTTPWYSDPANKQTADTTAAGTALDDAGWALANNKRSKDGADLTLTVVAYPFRPGLPKMLPTVKANLEAVGITVNDVVTNGNWENGFPCSDTVCFANGEWDLLMWAQNSLPAGDPLAHLNLVSTGSIAGKAGYEPASATLTAIAAVDGATTHAARVTASAAAQAAIKTEMPISNIATMDFHVAVSDKMKNVMGYTPYGSDYYVIRADAPLMAKVETETTDSSAMSMPVALALCAALLF